MVFLLGVFFGVVGWFVVEVGLVVQMVVMWMKALFAFSVSFGCRSGWVSFSRVRYSFLLPVGKSCVYWLVARISSNVIGGLLYFRITQKSIFSHFDKKTIWYPRPPETMLILNI